MSRKKAPLFDLSKKLNDKEIENFLNDSDAELSDDKNDNYEAILRQVQDSFEDCNSEHFEENVTADQVNDTVELEDDDENVVESTSANIASTSAASQSRNLKWLKKGFPVRTADDDFLNYDEATPASILDAFKEYLGMPFWEETAQITNQLLFDELNHHSLNTSAEELLHLTGCHILMGCLNFPQLKMYWQNEFRVPNIADTMSRNRFCQLRRYLRFFRDNDGSKPDRLWKIRPFLEPILKKCKTLPIPYHTSLDEQMIPFSGRCLFRQYMPCKPNPLALKNFVLAASDGLVLNFHIYTGKGSVDTKDMKELGLGGSIVKLLTDVIRFEGCVYTDRFFTSLKSLEELKRTNIFQTGTVMKTRIGPVIKKFKDDKVMKRGEWDEWVREDEQVSAVKWKDNKSVFIISSYIGAQPETQCKRWSKEHSSKITLSQPAVVNMYNKYMGGVDLCDRYISLYRCYLRTKKWTIRAFNHFVDLIVVNCWIMYNRNPARETMSLLDYKLYVGSVLIGFSSKAREANVSKRKNSDVDPEDNDDLSSSSKRRKVSLPLVMETRFDGFEHFPKFIESNNASRCRNHGCTSRTRTMCLKCNLYLCTNGNNCFLKYHEKT